MKSTDATVECKNLMGPSEGPITCATDPFLNYEMNRRKLL